MMAKKTLPPLPDELQAALALNGFTVLGVADLFEDDGAERDVEPLVVTVSWDPDDDTLEAIHEARRASDRPSVSANMAAHLAVEAVLADKAPWIILRQPITEGS